MHAKLYAMRNFIRDCFRYLIRLPFVHNIFFIFCTLLKICYTVYKYTNKEFSIYTSIYIKKAVFARLVSSQERLYKFQRDITAHMQNADDIRINLRLLWLSLASARDVTRGSVQHNTQPKGSVCLKINLSWIVGVFLYTLTHFLVKHCNSIRIQ